MDGEPPKKQANLSQFFEGGRASKVSNHEQGSTSQATTTKVRRLHRSTAEKWNTCTEGLAKYSSSVLLVLNGKGDYVDSLSCSVCKRFQNQICGMKHFSLRWASSRGNTRLQHDSALEHAKSDAHKAAFQMRLRAEGYDASERSEQSLTEVRQNKQCSLLEGENGQEDKRDDPEEIRSCISRR